MASHQIAPMDVYQIDLFYIKSSITMCITAAPALPRGLEEDSGALRKSEGDTANFKVAPNPLPIPSPEQQANKIRVE